MVAKSDLPRFGPFRTGLVVTTFGLAMVLGTAHGGYLGRALEGGLRPPDRHHRHADSRRLPAARRRAPRSPARPPGAILRRSGRAVRSAARRPAARRGRPPHLSRPPQLRRPRHSRSRPLPAPIDGVEEFPDIVSPRRCSCSTRPSRCSRRAEGRRADLALRRHRHRRRRRHRVHASRPGILRRSKAAAGGHRRRRARASPRRSSRRSRTSASTRPSIGEIAGPRVTRYELQLAPGTKVSKVAGAEGRPLLRARDDRDPHPRADPGQAGGRRRGAQPLAEPRHARRHLRRPARDVEPARRSGSARTSPATPSGPTSRACRTC